MKDLSKAERRDRCYECGAKGQMAAACPTKKEVQQKAVSAGDSPASSIRGERMVVEEREASSKDLPSRATEVLPSRLPRRLRPRCARGASGAVDRGRSEADAGLHGAEDAAHGASAQGGRGGFQ